MLQCYYVKVWSVFIWNRWNDWLFHFWRTFIFSDSSVLIEKFRNYNHIYAFVLYSLHFLFQRAVVCYTMLIEFFFFDVCWMGYKWCWFIVDFWLVVEWLCSWFFVDHFIFIYERQSNENQSKRLRNHISFEVCIVSCMNVKAKNITCIFLPDLLAEKDSICVCYVWEFPKKRSGKIVFPQNRDIENC